jgi:coproporphyrinogen III oxidase
MSSREEITGSFMKLQEAICSGLEQEDGKGRFSRDDWTRVGGGGGLTRAITNGNVLEKGCVNFSAVSGKLPPFLYKETGLDEKHPYDFYATGVSIVMHPNTPHVPIIHMNVRYFEVIPLSEAGKQGIYWFGGGIDLTPHYVVAEDAKVFHRLLKGTCDRHHPGLYPEFKKNADDYFFIRHRNETRGIGGIFFDKLAGSPSVTKDQRFAFVMDVGQAFLPAYLPLVRKYRDMPFSEAEKQWQYLRRGRYVEFNLVYDRGTRFGLETNGRTESILLSLPPQAQWTYDHRPEPGSREAETLELLQKGHDWAV